MNLDVETIRCLRRRRAWSQEALAEAARLSPRTVQRIEAGGSASLRTAGLLSAALDVPVGALYEVRDTPRSPGRWRAVALLLCVVFLPGTVPRAELPSSDRLAIVLDIAKTDAASGDERTLTTLLEMGANDTAEGPLYDLYRIALRTRTDQGRIELVASLTAIDADHPTFVGSDAVTLLPGTPGKLTFERGDVRHTLTFNASWLPAPP